MIKQVKAKYFRQYENRSFDLGPGLVVIKGPNEAGKSTLLEIIGYCLFGSKAIRDGDTLADAVTWEHPVSKLYAETTFVISDTEYRVTRKKSGAELFVNGKLSVTGQKEVTCAIEAAIGVPSKNAFNLLIAKQDAIRGALQSGNAEVTALIEKLADFDAIDNVIHGIQDRLSTGSTITAKERLSAAQETVNEAKVTEPNFDALEQDLVSLTSELASLGQIWADADKVLIELGKEHAAANANIETRKALQGSLVSQQNELSRTKTRINELKDIEPPSTENILILEDSLWDLRKAQERYTIYQRYLNLPIYPEDFWDEDMESLENEIAECKRKHTELTEEKQGIETEIKILESKYIVAGKCTTCGTVLGHTDEGHNAQLDDAIASHNLKVSEIDTECQELLEMGKTLLGIKDSDLTYATFSESFPDEVTEDCSEVPRHLVWAGKIPSLVEDKELTEVESMLKELEAQGTAYDNARERIHIYAESIDVREKSISKLTSSLLDIPEVDINALTAKISETRKDVASKKLAYDTANDEVNIKSEALRAAKQSYKDSIDRYETAVKALETAKKDLEDLEFNNDLLTAIRKAKPKIVDRLWSTLLHAVSTYFSTMRNKPSQITKDSTGFRVNEKSSSSLSGSASDCLGIAIRVALSKTFLPHILFIILDEPWSAMDQDRTEILVGFLLAAGFAQTVVVTHETLTEGSADQLINV